MLKIAAIVPTWNEAPRIGRLTKELLGSCDEVLVADGGSQDATRQVARAAGARVVVAPKGRGLQLAAGVANTAAEVVWFVHADSRVPVAAGHSLKALAAKHPWGCCAVTFEEDDGWLRFTSAWMNARARRGGGATGDMGQWFVRSFLEQLGGVPPLGALEDLVLSERAGRRHPCCVAPVVLSTSGRRWVQEGYLATTLRHWSLRAALQAGLSPARLAHHYATGPRSPA